MGPRTVLVHGDHHLSVRLRPAMAAAGLRIVAHLTSPMDLADAIIALNPEVLVTDMALDGHDLLPAVSQAVRLLPRMRLIVLSPWLDRGSVRAALSAGARGVLVSGGKDPEELARRILRVAGGATIVEDAA